MYPRLSPTAATLLAAILIAHATLPTISATAGAPNTLEVCGRVVNEAGWPVSGAAVTLSTTDPFFARVHGPVETDAAGRFLVTGAWPVAYDVIVHHPANESGAGGAVYAPTTERRQASATDGACTDGESGTDVGDIALTAPAHGFATVRALDATASTPDAPAPLPGAHVNLSLVRGPTAATAADPLGAYEAATTDGEGVARITCLQGPNRVLVDAAAYDTARADFTCQGGHQELFVEAWRSPVTLTVAVADAATGQAVAGADVSLSAPAQLANACAGPYDCDGATNATGAASARVPWAAAPFALSVTRAHYAAHAAHVAVSPGMAPHATVPVALQPTTTVVRGALANVMGDAVAGTLEFDSDNPAHPSNVTRPTASNGTFNATLQTGTHAVNVTAPGHHARDCALTVSTSGATWQPATCLTLVSLGHGAVTGRLTDAATGHPLSNATVDVTCTDRGGNDTLTGQVTSRAGGAYGFEAPPGQCEASRSHGPWRLATTTVAIQAAGDLVASDLTLARSAVPITGALVDGYGDAVAGVTVCATSGASNHCDATDATGAFTIPAPWTSHPTNATLDTAPYELATQAAHSGGTHFAPTPLSTSVPVGATATEVKAGTFTLTREPAAATTVTVTDGHTGAPVESASVQSATACDAPYDCHGTTDAAGVATLALPSGHAATISVTHGDYATTTLTQVTPGSAVAATVYKPPVDVTVTVVDAHTGGGLNATNVTATTPAGFECAPPGAGYACAATTDANGVATLRLPANAPGNVTIATPAGAHGVTLGPDAEEPAVRHGPASHTWAGGASVALEVRREVAPVTGVIARHDGAPLPGATVEAASERNGLTCDPDTDGPCATVTNGDGAYALDTPTATLETDGAPATTWRVAARAPGHYPEVHTGATAPGAVDFTLWPTAFDARVDVDLRDAAGQPVACEGAVDLIVVTLVNLNTGDERQGYWTRDAGSDCHVTIEQVPWDRSGDADTADAFLVRVEGPRLAPNATVAALGPAQAHSRVVTTVANHSVQAGTIQGVVSDVDAVPSMGAPGLLVAATLSEADNCLHPQTAGHTQYAITDGDGRYAITVPCSGAYTVALSDPTARYSGPEPSVAEVPADGATVTHDLGVTRTAGRLTATVVDAATGAPVPQATVTIAGADVGHTATAKTGPDGTASFDAPWGEYEVAAEAPRDGAEWTVGHHSAPAAVAPGADGAAVVALASYMRCQPPGGGVCSPQAVPGDSSLVQVTSSVAGAWTIHAPTVGDRVTGEGRSVSVDSEYSGNGNGTWIVVFEPAEEASQPGPVRLVAHLTVGGEDTTMEAWFYGATAPPRSLVWMVHAHSGRSGPCAPAATCPGGGSLQGSFTGMRLFVPDAP